MFSFHFGEEIAHFISTLSDDAKLLKSSRLDEEDDMNMSLWQMLMPQPSLS